MNYPSESIRLARAQGTLVFALAATGLVTACSSHQTRMTSAPPPIPQQVVSAAPVRDPAVQAAALDTAREKHIDIDTHGAEVDVRTLLDFIANTGGFSLVYSPDIKKHVRVTLNDVPVSVALQTVLSLADLTIETATPSSKMPGSTSVVFYQLPVNVDSLSIDAIMKRFGVSRGVAEMLVQGRQAKSP